MKPAILTAFVVASLCESVFAQAFANDNDGLLDVGEVLGFPDEPENATGELTLVAKGIEDLDGTSLLTNLQSLVLAHNDIASIERGDFDGLDNLQSLDLYSNAITNIEQGDFNGLANLQTLGLGSNVLASIEQGDFDGLPNLQMLTMGRSAIASIGQGSFSGLTELESLELNGNDLTSIDSGAFDGLSNLQALDLNSNDITRIDKGDFNELTNLRTLQLVDNAIARIEPGAFEGLFNLELLDLSANEFEELNLTAATFDNLSRFGVDYRVPSLVIDDARLSQDAFRAILFETATIIDASLIGLTFNDGNPPRLDSLFDIDTLDNIWVDSSLYDLYASEFDAFAGKPGKSVTVVPEPSSVLLALATSICLCRQLTR